jgi:CDP-glycerol glycerophosphotransferase
MIRLVMGGPRARLRGIARRATLAVQYERRLRARRLPIDDRTVVYESFAGNGMLCNPEAIFRAALAADDLHHLHHVWALADFDEYAATIAEFADNPRVSFVKRGSSRYYRALATAKYLVNNATFPDPFGKRAAQIYLNTWHGTPLKAMGYDVPHGAMSTGNVVRNLVSADYLLAPNRDTEEMYLSGYRMANVFRGRMIAEGTPRIDRQFGDEAARAHVRSLLTQHGVAVHETDEVLLYAPTWKGNFYAPTDDIVQLRELVESLAARTGSKYRVLLKVHQQVFQHARNDSRLRGILVPNDIPSNDLLAITDVVVTDYSSIFIDFLATGRPVLFYAPDLDDYAVSRGLYLPPEQWPGPICRDVDQLVERVNAIGTGTNDDPQVAFADAYAAARDRYCTREDGRASARIVDIVFRGATNGYDLRAGFADGRSPILINVGGMLANGITASALSLLDNLDHNRYDVSVSFPHTTMPERLQMIDRINPQVRLFPQPASLNGSKLRIRMLAAVNGRSARRRQVLRSGYTELMRAEWHRSFGASRFDAVVDFSGYEPYWIKLLASRPSGGFAIWLHNDIHAELSNAARAARLRERVRGAVALYRTADHLVSVSEALNEVNRTKLAGWASADQFTYARNTINAERVRRMAEEVSAIPPVASVRTFVTAGRLSPEKNHVRLVRAFAIVHAANPDTRLVILGSGPQLGRLRALVDELELSGAVLLAGHQPNPYPMLAQSDCFVLSSDYEGQPMALLEALILGMPVVTTAFDSVRGALTDGGGLVVARDVDALAAGMQRFLAGEVPAEKFDPAAYNEQAMAEFYRAIGSA